MYSLALKGCGRVLLAHTHLLCCVAWYMYATCIMVQGTAQCSNVWSPDQQSLLPIYVAAKA